ncbi:MAG: BTAD domain-containing putative transcriptional regulator [Actinomycetota bacterium]
MSKRVSQGTTAEQTPDVMIRVFGGVGVTDGPDPVSIGGPKQRRLLGLLAIRAGSIVDLDWLAEYLWDDDERPEASAPALRTYLSRLRQALPAEAGEWIETAPSGYRLDAPRDAVEHLRFAELRMQAAAARHNDDPLTAHALLDAALELWRGEPFRELDDLDWARSDIERLRLDRLEVLEERWETSLALGRHTQITGELAAFTSEHGTRDRAVRQLALALHRSGRTPDALRTIADHRRLLAEESGLDPSADMVQLEQALFADDPALAAPDVGRPLRGYRLLEEAGVGAFSVVWRGEQPSVQRDVAIKQIRSELATQPDFIRRFEAEAHLVARLEHPHIVPLIDYWRDPDSAYLVMRWLSGGTLERRLDDGVLTLDDTLRLADQIGGALGSAHARGVVHRDVKTANILFDDDGNAFLTDFGIALGVAETTGPEAALSPGTPAYSAPEQIRGERLGPEADVFSLGVVVFECLAGRLPFASHGRAAEDVDRRLHDEPLSLSELRVDVPSRVSDAVSRAIANDAEERYASVAAFVSALRGGAESDGSVDVETSAAASTATSSDGRGNPAADITNPYVGLRAFDDADRDQFFGRRRLVDRIVGRLAGDSITARSVVVVGPSGSGKSSVVRAGVLPALRRGEIEGSDQWFVTTMVPGAEPFEALEAALLRVAVNPPATLLDQLRDGRRGILRSVRRSLADDSARVVVVVDQMEELFTRCTREAAEAFLDALAVAVEDPTSPLRFIATLRADYYHRPLEHTTFASILTASAIDVTPLAADELEEAIVKPAEHVGVDFEPGLVARIVADAAGQPSALPLLQYSLSELFDRCVVDEPGSATLTIDAYDRSGGLPGALSARAEALYDGADGERRAATRTVFGRLTSPRDASGDLRQRVPVADLGSDAATAWVLDHFGAARLFTFDRDDTTREPTAEVAHEALLREWPRLVEWLAADRDLLREADAISAAATSWDRGGRAPTDLYRGGRLESAVALLSSTPERLRQLDIDFIEASRTVAEAERQTEAKRVTRLHRLVAGTAAALVVALIAGGVALVQQRRADDEAAAATAAAETADAAAADAEAQAELARAAAAEADVATLISRSAALSTDDATVSRLLALEAYRRSPEPATEQAVLNALGNSAAANLVSSSSWFEFDGDCTDWNWGNGGEDLLGIIDGRLVTKSLRTDEVTDHGPSPTNCGEWRGNATHNVAIISSPDGREHWVGTFDDPAATRITSEESRFVLGRAFAAGQVILLEELPSIFEPRTAIFVDMITGEETGVSLQASNIGAAGASPDGSITAVALWDLDDPANDQLGRTVVVDTVTGDEIAAVRTPLPVVDLAFDRAGQSLALVEDDSTIHTVHIPSGEIVATMDAGSSAPILDIGVRDDGLYSVLTQGRADLLDPMTGPIDRGADVSDATFFGMLLSDDTLAAYTEDGRIELHDLGTDALAERAWRTSAPSRVSFSSGQAAARPTDLGPPEIIDLSTGDRTPVDLTVDDGTELVAGALYAETDGYWVLDSRRLGIFARWADGELVERFELDRQVLDGTRLGDLFAAVTVTGGEFDTVDLIDLTPDSGRVLNRIQIDPGDAEPGENLATTAHPTVDGGAHVATADGRLLTFDADGALATTVETGLGSATVITMDPSSGWVALARDGDVVIVDPATSRVDDVPVNGRVANLGWARDGELLVITTFDGAIRLWDVERGESGGLMFEGTGATTGSPSWYDEATDSIWVSTSGQVLQLPLSANSWIERACAITLRDLTPDEWDRFVPGGGDVQSACD